MVHEGELVRGLDEVPHPTVDETRRSGGGDGEVHEPRRRAGHRSFPGRRFSSSPSFFTFLRSSSPGGGDLTLLLLRDRLALFENLVDREHPPHGCRRRLGRQRGPRDAADLALQRELLVEPPADELGVPLRARGVLLWLPECEQLDACHAALEIDDDHQALAQGPNAVDIEVGGSQELALRLDALRVRDRRERKGPVHQAPGRRMAAELLDALHLVGGQRLRCRLEQTPGEGQFEGFLLGERLLWRAHACGDERANRQRERKADGADRSARPRSPWWNSRRAR